MIRVGIVGYGTIGKRIADAVSKQDDMEVVGVFKTRPNFEAWSAIKRGYPLYVPEDRFADFEKNGIPVKGSLKDLLSVSDIVVDATPNKVGKENKKMYVERKIKAIFQGGEKADVADVSFNALANYEEAIGKSYVRVVSCNTTGLVRVLYLLDRDYGVRSVRGTIVRRGADPKEVKKGPLNSIVLDPPHIPSHHAEDVKTILRHIDIVTVAVAVPTTLMHVHILNIRLRSKVSKEDVVKSLESTPRILLVNSGFTGIKSTSEIIEVARDIGRSRYDIYENVVWEDTLAVDGDEVFIVQGVQQEAIVVPENIDAIRAVSGVETSGRRSMMKTDKVLRIGEWPWSKLLLV